MFSVQCSPAGTPLNQLRSFLVSACHPTDIVLPGADSQSFILLGETAEPDGWKKRHFRYFEAERQYAFPD